jgi:predicted RNA-binding protein with PUA-like domain
VRNYSAANNLRAMKIGDEAFFYHSNIGLEIVAIITISQEHFIDPSDEKARFVAVKVKPSRKLRQPVTLKAIKANPSLAEMEMLRQSRLSVAPVRATEWKEILQMAGE